MSLVQRIEAATPGNRDRAIDGLRALAAPFPQARF